MTHDLQPDLAQLHVQPPGRTLLLEEVVDLGRLHKEVAAGDDEGDTPPAGVDDGWELVLLDFLICFIMGL